jgi:hypothetical protein
MSFRALVRCLGCVVPTTALLAGCGGGVPSATPSTAAATLPARHLNLARSWMAPDANKQWLLYVSDGASGTIDVYNYRAKHGKLVGQITGLSFPYGQCVDRAGDVYVVDNETSTIYEYAHGGTTPIATATDDYGKPDGCAVDPTSGSVAVSNFSGASSSTAGGVDLFRGGLSGSQTYYTSAQMYRIFPGAYDPSGNFFAQGTNYSGVSNFAEMPSGKKKFTMLTGLTIAFPGSVQWDGYYLAATDQDYQFAYTTMIYRVTVSGSQATVVRSSHLTDNCYPGHGYMVAIQPFVTGISRQKNTVVAGNLNCPSRENFFDYATGGGPTRSLPAKIAPVAPYGQSVSPPSR